MNTGTSLERSRKSTMMTVVIALAASSPLGFDKCKRDCATRYVNVYYSQVISSFYGFFLNKRLYTNFE